MSFGNNNDATVIGLADNFSKKDKIALIMWALINNNVINRSTQVILTVLDFGL